MNGMLKRFMHLFQLLSAGKVMLTLVAVNLAIVVMFGGIFYSLEDVGLLDSLYWSATTFFTVGYGDISPKTDAGKMMSFSYYLVSEAGRNFMTASLIAWLVNTMSRATRGLSQVHGRELLLIVNPVDQQHFLALLRALRHHGLVHDVVVISDKFEERPTVPDALGRVLFTRGNPLDLATYRRANVRQVVAAIVCATSLNQVESDEVTAAIVKLIESIDSGRIVTVAEVLVAEQLRWFQSGDKTVLVDRAVCLKLAETVQAEAGNRSTRLKFNAYDAAKNGEFIACLAAVGVQFERVEEDADIEVVFASDLDRPLESDAKGLAQATDATSTTVVIVEYLAVQHAHLFAQWDGYCLDEIVAGAVAEELLQALST